MNIAAVRRPWRTAQTIFLLGPGGVGKSTLGAALAQELGWPLVDLDVRFCDEIGIVGPYIAAHGYARYRAENLALAQRLVDAIIKPSIFVTSSGFLADAGDRDAARALVRTGYAVVLLPSLDIEEATAIVVGRQLTRGFGFERRSETEKFRQRFALYRDEGDMLVVTAQPAELTARELPQALNIPVTAAR